MDPATLLKFLETKTPKEIFGTEEEINYRKYAIICHPDKNPGDPIADQAFKLLGRRRLELHTPAVTIQSKSRTYVVDRLYAKGDITDVHLASANGHSYLMKVARDSKFSALMSREVTAIKQLMKLEANAYFPSLTESFSIKGGKSVTVMPRDEGFYTLEEVAQRFPRGLEARHLAWMFNRLLASLGYTHALGLVHGHITPAHFLIHAQSHGGRLIDWTGHVKVGEKLTSISTDYKAFYPPEVFAKEPATPALDVYMAAKCANYLLAGNPDVDPKIRGFLKVCTLEKASMRPDNAWALHEDFNGILRKVFGPPKFQPFSMES